MELRSQVILLALAHLASTHRRGEPLRIIEVGCMFNEDEGCSTYLIADFLLRRGRGNRFISIDYDLEHINTSKALIHNRNSRLSNVVEYRHGPSLSVLPEVLAELENVHLVYLDGGANPEVCLCEFERAMTHLQPEGVILVDDAQEIPQSEYYRFPRPCGKATLILPMLITANYLSEERKTRVPDAPLQQPKDTAHSHFIGQLREIDVPLLGTSSFRVVGGRHRMLAYGSSAFIAKTGQLKETVGLREVARTLRYLVSSRG